MSLRRPLLIKLSVLGPTFSFNGNSSHNAVNLVKTSKKKQKTTPTEDTRTHSLALIAGSTAYVLTGLQNNFLNKLNKLYTSNQLNRWNELAYFK